MLNGVASAHSPVEFLEVLKVEPARLIEHSVELKSGLDADRVETKLVGPELFSRAVGCMNRSVKEKRAYLNWFKIEGPREQPRKEVSVLDIVRGSSDKMLTIQSAEYFLSPAQLITTGPPEPIPDGLDLYKAYRIIEAESLSMDVELTGSVGATKRRLGKPLFLCVAARQWHHEEYVAASHPNDCFVVYELDSQDHVQTNSTIDQFGLNQLRTTKTQWLCVRAALLSVK
jgi:hypothetical protein